MENRESWRKGSVQAIAILRVSSYGQKDNTSREVQDAEITAYAAIHSLSIVKRVPIVESAKDSENRDKYHAAIAWALENKVRHLLFYMSDRESRNFTDMEKMEKLILQDRIVVHYVRDRKQLHRWSAPSDFSMREIQAWQDKQLSRTISTKVNDAMLNKAKDGWYPGNIPPLGYKHQKKRDEFGEEMKRGTTIVKDPDDQKVRQVRREYELRAQRLSYEDIRRKIVEEGFIPPHKIRSYFAGCIEQRLKNPFYRGYFTWQGTEYRGKHPIIIDAAVLRAVDTTFGNKSPVRRAGEAVGIFAGGWLKCGHSECGCNVVYDPKRKINKETGQAKIYPFYHCTNGRGVHESMKGMNVTEDKIWPQFETAVDAVLIDGDFAQRVADALNETKVKVQEAIRREMDQYRVAQQDLVSRENKLFDLFLAGAIDEATYKGQRERLQAKHCEYTNLLELAQLQISDAGMETAKSVLELATTAKAKWIRRDSVARRELLDEILSNPVLDGPTVRYQIKKPFLILSEMAQNYEWRPSSYPQRTPGSNPGISNPVEKAVEKGGKELALRPC